MHRIFALLLLILLCSTACPADSWSKYVSKDGSFSFQYPTGWTVNPQESIIEITNTKSDEQILVIALPNDPKKTPKDTAKDMLSAFKAQMPDLKATNWQDADTSAVTFDIVYSDKSKDYCGLVLVLKDTNAAHWFSYSGSEDGYSKANAAKTLEQLVSSISSGTVSNPPAISGEVEESLKSFIFTLEFALGGPLTVSQEKTILDKMREGTMVSSKEGKEQLAEYPKLVKVIMALGQSDIEEVRKDLENGINEWLAESDADDPAVKVIRDQLASKGKAIVKGEPALTEMAATAYSEMYAYSELLQRNSTASPEQISASNVKEIRGQLVKAWSGFSQKEKRQIATTPGLWLVTRKLLDQGTADERSKLLNQLRKVAVTPQKAASTAQSSSSKASKDAMKSWVAHNTLMEMKKITFNTYMWSRGFNYLPATGKMW